MSASAITIVDTGGANLASLVYAFERIGVTASISSEPTAIIASSHIVLPGVGAAGDAMERIRGRDLLPVLKDLAQPVLGICLGMHLLSRYSVEQDCHCLGITDTDVQEIPASSERPAPHMGWNQISTTKDNPLTERLSDNAYFYFVHSFALPVTDETVATYEYGTDYAAIVRVDNFFGCQFHPERSAENGERLLKNFVELPSCA